MTLPTKPSVKGLTGERFRVVYHLAGTEEEAREKAEDICFEETVEFPKDLVPDGDIREHIVGRLEDLSRFGEGLYAATVSFAIETVGDELPQLLNVIFGNISMKPGIRLERLDLPESVLRHYRGPRFGKTGLRKLLGAHDRPLFMTALKPVGLSSGDLAGLAYSFALGGIDIVKDDHGLANQAFAPFEERIERCAAAVAKAHAETGQACIYMPNITAPAGKIIDRARFAKQAGAGALLICPGLVGLDTMRQLADDDALALPIASHPSFYGSFVTSSNGISHYALYGQLQRLAGADASIYPNFGGRFSFSKEACLGIVAGCTDPMGNLKPIFATPGGGMRLHNLPAMKEVYGQEVIYLIGGDLYRTSHDLTRNVRDFIRLIRQ